MRITILNGNPDASNTAFDDYLGGLSGVLVSDQHEVTMLELREMDIKYYRLFWLLGQDAW